MHIACRRRNHMRGALLHNYIKIDCLNIIFHDPTKTDQ